MQNNQEQHQCNNINHEISKLLQTQSILIKGSADVIKLVMRTQQERTDTNINVTDGNYLQQY
jgi:hypothetical protein